MVATRRAFLATAGAGALAAAGCGARPEPPPDAELLAPPLAAALALASAYDALGERALAAVERTHARKLRAAGAREGARAPVTEASGKEGALELERASMRALVDAVGLVRDLRTRVLVADLLGDDAAHESRLLAELHRNPIPSAFPDGRAV